MSALRHYARLARLPNLPSALADIGLAGLAVGLAGRVPAFLLLAGASACLYMAGMVLNDYFDADEDRRDRPDRPIPSGAIAPRSAAILGFGLLAAGVALAFAAGSLIGSLRPGLTAVALLLAILAYDGWLKESLVGPASMGACRFLNVLMGATLAGPPPAVAWHLALVVGLYIAGVTWLARTEARRSNKGMLTGAAVVILAALALALLLPGHRVSETDAVRSPLHTTTSPLFPYLLVLFGFVVAFPIHRAIEDPSPSRVQAAVRRCLVGLILFDAVLATAAAGAIGLVLLVLMLPAVYLNRKAWLYAT